MQRIRVLLLFGGESAEHEVSIASARNVYAAMDDQKYDITLCYITKDGRWRSVEDIETLEDSGHSLLPVLGGKQFVTDPGDRVVVPDVILPILHGPNGEDGSVQGLAQLLHIPIVGCGIIGSAVCMDKEITKQLLQMAGIKVADYAVWRAGDDMPDFAHLTLTLGNPIFVKPANMGSSVGVSKVHNEAEFHAAIQEARKHDSKILIEQGIHGREIECAVLGNELPEASSVGEIKPRDGFYSYDEKYSTQSQSELIIPADLPPDVTETVRRTAVKAYRVLACRGLARVDCFAASDGIIYVNELNTLPGFTNISMYPKLWRHTGVSYSELIDKLIHLALT